MTAGPSSDIWRPRRSAQAWGTLARSFRNSCRAHSRGRPYHLRRIHARMSLSSRSRLLLARQRPPLRGLLHERRRASDFRASRSRGNSRKCGSCWVRLARSFWPKRAPESAAWPATSWISARARFPNFMRRWNMSRSSVPARAAPSMRRASRIMRRQDAFPAPAKSRARFPPGAFFQMNCWTLCPRTASSWRTARCEKYS